MNVQKNLIFISMHTSQFSQIQKTVKVNSIKGDLIIIKPVSCKIIEIET